jgi:hypothetical protein
MSFFSGLKKVLNFGGANFGRGGDGSGHTSRFKKLPACLRMEVDPSIQWDFIGELGDGAFGKVYKVSTIMIKS